MARQGIKIVQDRLRKARRLVSMQAQIKRAEQWKLAELERWLAEGEAAQRELMAALGEDHALYDLFIDTLARRLRSLSEEEGRVLRAKGAQTARLLASAQKLKSVERWAAGLSNELMREAAKKELLDLFDATVPAETQASRKLAGR